MKRARGFVLPTAFCLLLTVTPGCESLQRKFSRKPKQPQAPPSPIISFQDYSRAMTPLDRYRKHYLMFDYWNGELINSVQATPLNPKRYKRASAESLAELRTLQGLLAEERAARLIPMVEERATLDRRLQRGSVSAFDANSVTRELESHSRQIHRDFFWRDVQDQLQPSPLHESLVHSPQSTVHSE